MWQMYRRVCNGCYCDDRLCGHGSGTLQKSEACYRGGLVRQPWRRLGSIISDYCFDPVMWYRPVTLREFANYVKAMGRYVTYGEAMRAVKAVFGVLSTLLPESDMAMARNLLPEALQPVWEDSEGQTRTPGSFIRIQPDRHSGVHGLIEAVCTSGEYLSPAEGMVAISAVFGALKEKLRDAADAWSQLIPEEGRKLWEKALTVDQLQDVSQCV
ncbi:DUF2267 domain-containing protein [Candidatus Hakubella thermalkaliphila]|nr:DUF2267 domain-containing protein [Candidatus Hakubella thermalkaliphila]